jgi:adenosylcobinamide kinase / adenosylcobinamide-phosphate guanylyltransferase
MPDLPQLTLVLGGARSGKSRLAEAQIMQAPPAWTYIATAEAFDDEMRVRIAEHRARRDQRWLTVDAPYDLPERLLTLNGPVLIDCLTLWLSNVMLAEQPVATRCTALIDALKAVPGPIVAVSNEVGLSIVPDNALGRRFRDAQGRLNQDVAAIADRVIFVAAGLPLVLKDISQ